MFLDQVRQDLAKIIHDEASVGRSKQQLKTNPRRIGKILARTYPGRYRDVFSMHLTDALKQAGYPSLTPVVKEEIDRYFTARVAGGVEARVCARQGGISTRV